MIFPTPEPLADEAIVLRRWRDDDAPRLAEAWRDPEIRRWTAVPSRTDEAAARRWIEGWEARRARGLSLDLVIAPSDDLDAVAGEVGLVPRGATVELGWWVEAGWRRRGIATRAVGLVAGWCREALRVEPCAAVDPRNVGAWRVARTHGLPPPAASTSVS